ncbi:MAG: hypothetical protein HFI90_06905 [Clostridia bacterium]|nr:hypothetical protein [Clostridia bacterium]
MSKKYEFTGETKDIYGVTVHQIRALRDFGDVKAGDIGGWIESEENLSHNGTAWVYGNGVVCDSGRVCNNGVVCDSGRVCNNGVVCDSGRVYGNGVVCGKMQVENNRQILMVDYIGSRYGSITFANDTDGNIAVACGCFYGTIGEFAAKVKEKHRSSIYAKEYEAAIELAKIHIMR